MKYYVLLVIIILSFSCGSNHQNLNSDIIVYDDEALRVLKESDDLPEIIIQNVKIPNANKESFSIAPLVDTKDFNRDSLKNVLFDSLSLNDIMFFEDIFIYAYSKMGNVYEIIISPLGLSGLEFKTNKKLNVQKDLKLLSIFFGQARIENIGNKVWFFKDGKMVYSDTKYSQFKFIDIKPFDNLKLEEVLNTILSN